jgi:hypothetical protein
MHYVKLKTPEEEAAFIEKYLGTTEQALKLVHDRSYQSTLNARYPEEKADCEERIN